MSILISGCGDIGQQLAHYISSKGQRCQALVRSAASLAKLKHIGIDSILCDLDQQPAPIISADLIYYFVPPPKQGRIDQRLSCFLAQLQNPPQKIILLSTTGVYGDCQGAWITESQAPNPQADRAFRRLDAERQLQAYCAAQGCDWVILRVPGIYGINKLPLKRLQAGKAILDPAESGYSNRIHSHDLVRACWAAAQDSVKNTLIHVSDGQPSSMSDYFLQVAATFALPKPQILSKSEALAQLSPEMLSYLLESKRLDIGRMREVLGIEPIYPNLNKGLAAIKQATGLETP